MDRTDEELVSAFNDGEIEALKILVNRYTDHIYNYMRKLGMVGDSADGTQETFVKVWKNLKKFNPEKASFKTWLFTIARNTATDFMRKRKIIVFSDIENNAEEDSMDTILDEEILPHEALQKLEDIQVLEKSLLKLPLPYRNVLTLHYQEEMTFEEIGKVLGKPLNTVKSWHRRALLALRGLLDHVLEI